MSRDVVITDELMQRWCDNYGLTDRTPVEAARWWIERMGGDAPAGCVAALGLAINEIRRLRKVLRDAQAHVDSEGGEL